MADLMLLRAGGYPAPDAAGIVNKVVSRVGADAIALDTPGFEERASGRVPTTACDAGYSRRMVPEAVMGDHADCVTYCDDLDRLIEGYAITATPAMVQLSTIDFSTVGPVGQVRSALYRMYGSGGFSITRFPGAVAGANFDIPVAVGATAPRSIGVRVDVSLPFAAYAPWDCQVQTLGWTNEDGQVVDRNIQLRVNNALGFSLYLPWAVRITPGMNNAMNQVGIVAAPGPAIVRVVAPPPAILAAMSATAQLLTAFSPLTAAWAGGEGILTGLPVAAPMTSVPAGMR